MMASLRPREAKEAKGSSTKGVAVGILISTMLGLGWMLDKLGAQFFTAETYNIFIWAVPLLFIYLPSIKLSAITLELKLASWKIFLLAGLNVAGYLMQLRVK